MTTKKTIKITKLSNIRRMETEDLIKILGSIGMVNI